LALKHLRRLFHSRAALAVPITFLVLLVSTLGIVSFTYYFAVQRVSAESQVFKVSTAKESLLSLDDTICKTLWQPGSSSTFELADCGGRIKIQPTSNVLTLEVNDSFGVHDTVFNASLGQVIYELPYSRSQAGLYLKGDSQSITNRSGASISQLFIENGEEHPEIHLRYRPTVSYVVSGLEDGKAVNTIRVYVVNLNSSVTLALQGELPLKISCLDTQFISKDYSVSSSTENLVITSTLNGSVYAVAVPISTTQQGAVIHLETVVCNVAIERWLR
jgi:hypothetical protein